MIALNFYLILNVFHIHQKVEINFVIKNLCFLFHHFQVFFQMISFYFLLKLKDLSSLNYQMVCQMFGLILNLFFVFLLREFLSHSQFEFTSGLYDYNLNVEVMSLIFDNPSECM